MLICFGIHENAKLEAQVSNPDQLLTTKQVSEETGIPEATLRWFRQCGTGPAAFNIGRRKVVYRRSEITRWIAAQEAATSRGGLAV